MERHESQANWNYPDKSRKRERAEARIPRLLLGAFAPPRFRDLCPPPHFRVAKTGGGPLLGPLWQRRRKPPGVDVSRRDPPSSCCVSVNPCPLTAVWPRSTSRAARPTQPCWRKSG